MHAKIAVIGEGHLAFRIHKKLLEHHVSNTRIFKKSRAKELESSSFEACMHALLEADITAYQKIFIVDFEDRLNVQFYLAAHALNPQAEFYVSLFNETLQPHIASSNVIVINPAIAATNTFVEAAISGEVAGETRSLIALPHQPFGKKKRDWPLLFVAAFATVFAGATVFFHFSEHLSWTDALYFTATVITTTGFGDITLLHSALIAKVVGILLMFSGISLVSITFSLIVDQIVRRREELSRGHKTYKLKNHIIVCGLGRVGYRVCLKLKHDGHSVIAIEHNENNRFVEMVRNAGIDVFIGDAVLPGNLSQLCIEQARAIVPAIEDDMLNVEIALTARTLRPGIRVVVRIFDTEMAGRIRDILNIKHALSTSEIASQAFIDAAQL